MRSLIAPYLGLDRRIWALAAARAINTMGFSMVMPFMAIYIVGHGGSGATYGTIYLVAGLVAALSHGVAGEAADRLGRRRVMVAALACRAGNMVALGLAVTRGASITVLGLLVVSNGLLRALFEPAASAAVTDVAPAEHRVAAFGLQRMGVNLGWALGPALGGVFADHSYGTLFFFAAPVTLVAATLVARVRDRPRSAEELAARRERLTLRGIAAAVRENRPFFVYLVLVLGAATLTTQLFSTLSVFAKYELHMTERRIGLIYTVNGLLVVLLQVPAVAAIKRGGSRVALVVGPAVYSIAYLALGFSRSFTAIALSVALLTFGEVLFAPALSDMAAHLGDPRRLGRAFGLFGLMQQLGVSLGPRVGGFAFDHLRHEPLAMWGSLGGAMFLVGLGFAAFSRGGRFAGVRL